MTSCNGSRYAILEHRRLGFVSSAEKSRTLSALHYADFHQNFGSVRHHQSFNTRVLTNFFFPSETEIVFPASRSELEVSSVHSSQTNLLLARLFCITCFRFVKKQEPE